MSETTIRRWSPEGLVASPAFSHVAVIPPGATTVLVGGQNAVDADGALVGGDDLAAQTAATLDNLEVALAAAGATLADVVQWRILAVRGIDLHTGFAAVMQRLDPDVAPPLISVALVDALAVPGALVEIEAVAALLP